MSRCPAWVAPRMSVTSLPTKELRVSGLGYVMLPSQLPKGVVVRSAPLCHSEPAAGTGGPLVCQDGLSNNSLCSCFREKPQSEEGPERAAPAQGPEAGRPGGREAPAGAQLGAQPAARASPLQEFSLAPSLSSCSPSSPFPVLFFSLTSPLFFLLYFLHFCHLGFSPPSYPSFLLFLAFLSSFPLLLFFFTVSPTPTTHTLRQRPTPAHPASQLLTLFLLKESAPLLF